MPDAMGQDVPKTLEGHTDVDLAGRRIVLGWNLALPWIRTDLPIGASECTRAVLQYMNLTEHNTLFYTLPEDGFILKLIKEVACEVLESSLSKSVQSPRPALLLVYPDREHAANLGSVNAHNLGLSTYKESEEDDLELRYKWPSTVRLLKAPDFRRLITGEPECFRNVLRMGTRRTGSTPAA